LARPLLRVFLAVTIDGFIARADGRVDYLDPYNDGFKGWDAFFNSIGSIIMGRATYEQARSQGRWIFDDKRTFVLTSRDLPDVPAGVETFSDPAALVERLRREESKDIWHMGGGRSLAPFDELELIDRWELGIVPVILGSGIPLFPEQTDTFNTCRLQKCEQHENGLVELHYEPIREGED